MHTSRTDLPGTTSRRTLVRTGLVTGAVVTAGGFAGPRPALLDTRASAASPRLRRNPFTLGVASGDPSPGGVVLWTRLALDPLNDSGLGGMPRRDYQVRWQLSRDRRFRRGVRTGTARAASAAAHSVHVEPSGLRPGTEYFYRFRVGQWVSPVGRTRTAPAYDASGGTLAMSFVSCSQYEHGFFTAYRRLAQDEPDLVLHLGDYQYEYTADAYVAPGGNVRDHRGPETTTLAGYRQRLAQYKSDADLQAAHAVAPWLVVFDDHEVDNNWADDVAEKPEESAALPARRAAAFQAYYENMPLRRTSVPRGPDISIHRRLQWGRLANFHMLDTRQFRDDQACGDGYDDCPDADAPERSLPGLQQERWLADGFARSRARWDVLGQQVFFGRRDSTATPDNTVSMDAWDGYRASRDRVVRSWQSAGVRNPVVLTGDVHAHWASEVLQDFRAADSPVVGSEFVCSSITSGGDGYDEPTGQHPWAAYNPNLRFWTNLRGYVNTRITPQAFEVDYRCVTRVKIPDQPVFTRARFVVEDGVRGMRQTFDNPLPTRGSTLRALPAPRTDAQKIADTLAAETQ
ncbi:alkaline phosphatase [Marmoricola sp. Leaf446]|uniref:alkaline phosphatase D family protein n=1 Tax=Marmoricola sp. Leaf446 TaxID=1736379 RepID=UPI0006FFDDBB|nr:alkaline phosphatase D family protein [Marmoricola sp. Leaf446]KQT91183.1 alkaline phosphatase [Marmoricola sp. Leaf446]